ncbi:hypothetical protein [Ekhidna sp.]
MDGEVNQEEKSSRDRLKDKFQPGDKPTDEDFALVIDSFLNPEDDGVDVDEQTFKILRSQVLVNALDAQSGFIKELEVNGVLNVGTLNVDGNKVEEVWKKVEDKASFTGDITIDGGLKIGTGTSGSILSDGSAVFSSINVGSLKLGDDDLIIHWQSLDDENDGIKRTGPVQIDGTATVPLLEVKGDGTFQTLGIGGQVQSGEVLSITGEVGIKKPPNSSINMLFKVGGEGQFNALGIGQPPQESEVLSIEGKMSISKPPTDHTDPLLVVNGEASFQAIQLGGKTLTHSPWAEENEIAKYTGQVDVAKSITCDNVIVGKVDPSTEVLTTGTLSQALAELEAKMDNLDLKNYLTILHKVLIQVNNEIEGLKPSE